MRSSPVLLTSGPISLRSEYTKNLYTENDDSKPTLSFDKNISVLLLESQNNAIPPDLWPMFSGIQSTPLLLIRGELSEVLSKECAEKMQEINPAMEYVEVSNCGHTPLLTETVCTKAINSFLAKLN
jgi:pimeloyl-ACP methyl ester carboxylesterase